MVARLSFAEKELPPRARRILRWETVVAIDWGTTSACAENTPIGGFGVVKQGTTSACAENTQRRAGTPVCGWNYLRVRGEYSILVWPG